jgi:hypothetical protein
MFGLACDFVNATDAIYIYAMLLCIFESYLQNIV